MLIELGEIEALFRYPIKSMAAESLETATLGWHGIEGDRRLALHRIEDHGAFPWLTASKLPELVRFHPVRHDNGDLPTHIRTPEGSELPTFSEELAKEISSRHGSSVEMMQSKNGIFDDASLSLIASTTISEVSRLADLPADARRFRPNILLRALRPKAFQEDEWLGSELCFGEHADAPAIAVTMRDVRCAMLNIHPDTGVLSPQMMKAVVDANQNNAGIYGTVIRTGQLSVGQPVFLRNTK